jgi:hypothetical protein
MPPVGSGHEALIEHELRARRPTGESNRLAHIARTLDETRMQLARESASRGHVDRHQASRQ